MGIEEDLDLLANLQAHHIWFSLNDGKNGSVKSKKMMCCKYIVVYS